MEEKQVNSKFRIPNSVFLIISGASILGFWTMFIITDPNSLFRHGIINGIFHLFSEGSLAVICILTAFGLIMKISIGYKISYFAHGMLLSSVISAAAYYWLDPVDQNFAMIGMFAGYIICTLFFFITTYNKYWQ